MGNIYVGMNLEAIRHHDKPFEWGLDRAAEMGYRVRRAHGPLGPRADERGGLLPQRLHVERSAGDAKNGRRSRAENLRDSGPRAVGPARLPWRISEDGHPLRRGMRAPVVNTDEGLKAPWTTEAEDFVLMRYTLREASFLAERRGVAIGLECHAQYSKTPDGLDRIYHLVDSPAIGINLDTGNAYLAGQNPYTWLERVVDRLVHLHAKDITTEHSDAERGKVAGTPVGCACGDGVIDWKRVIEICRRAPRDIVMSVECGTIDQAERSLKHLTSLL